MNTYTEQDVRELAHQFDLAYPSMADTNFNQESIELSLKDNPEDYIGAICEFLIGYYNLGGPKEVIKATCAFTFEAPLNSMPKYLKDKDTWKIAVSSWRLKIGK